MDIIQRKDFLSRCV